MSELPSRLNTLAARDIMTAKLVVLASGESIGSAAAKLKQHGITGAPVVNEHDIPVGILSLSDMIVGKEVVSSVTDEPLTDEPLTGEPLTGEPLADEPLTDEPLTGEPLTGDDAHTWELFEHVASQKKSDTEETVSKRMSRRLVTVTDDTPLVEVARVMCDGHWHRVAVVDAAGSLCGIISTMDVLAALINAADESDE